MEAPAESSKWLESLTFDEDGLIATVAQDRLTGTVRMVAWMNREALTRTLETGYATFFSRSRAALWTKGETSGNKLRIRSVIADCDGDTLLLLVDPVGPSCHTGKVSCFFSPLGAPSNGPAKVATPFLLELEETIRMRQGSTGDASYTRSLLDGGPSKIGAKLLEEAHELGAALSSESDDRVLNEAADVLYHLLVGLRLRQLDFERVIEVLAGRAATSGHAEKAARKGSSV